MSASRPKHHNIPAAKDKTMIVSQRALKKQVLALLKTDNIEHIEHELGKFPPEKLLTSLFSGICGANEITKWNAVTMMGSVVAKLADQDMEAARIVMRRFMWSLNDESGGIGWGAPEAMAECLACHDGLAREYTHILVAFMREDGFFLEHLPLQRGLMWGIGRLGQARPELLHGKQAVRYLLPYLDSDDIAVRALAARALGFLKAKEASAKIHQLLDNSSEIHLYRNRKLITVRVSELAQEALAAISP